MPGLDFFKIFLAADPRRHRSGPHDLEDVHGGSPAPGRTAGLTGLRPESPLSPRPPYLVSFDISFPAVIIVTVTEMGKKQT